MVDLFIHLDHGAGQFRGCGSFMLKTGPTSINLLYGPPRVNTLRRWPIQLLALFSRKM